MTRGDGGIICVVAALVVCSLLVAAAPSGQESVQLKGPRGVTAIDPAVDATYRVEGSTGTVVFEVRNGEVRCVSSCCPDNVCVHGGPLAAGRPIVCAPEGVIASTTRGGELDAVSR